MNTLHDEDCLVAIQIGLRAARPIAAGRALEGEEFACADCPRRGQIYYLIITEDSRIEAVGKTCFAKRFPGLQLRDDSIRKLRPGQILPISICLSRRRPRTSS